jgi:hypothetical protein
VLVALQDEDPYEAMERQPSFDWRPVMFVIVVILLAFFVDFVRTWWHTTEWRRSDHHHKGPGVAPDDFDDDPNDV